MQRTKYKTDAERHQARLESKRKWREQNRSKVKKYNEEYYDANPDEQIERVRRNIRKSKSRKSRKVKKSRKSKSRKSKSRKSRKSKKSRKSRKS